MRDLARLTTKAYPTITKIMLQPRIILQITHALNVPSGTTWTNKKKSAKSAR